MTLLPSVTNCESAKGVPVTVTGVAQVKIMTENDDYLSTACEQFLGKSEQEIQDLLLETFEGHLRAIVGTMEVEELFQDRETFAHNVREVAATDVSKMGIKILSFTIKGNFPLSFSSKRHSRSEGCRGISGRHWPRANGQYQVEGNNRKGRGRSGRLHPGAGVQQECNGQEVPGRHEHSRF